MGLNISIVLFNIENLVLNINLPLIGNNETSSAEGILKSTIKNSFTQGSRILTREKIWEVLGYNNRKEDIAGILKAQEKNKFTTFCIWNISKDLVDINRNAFERIRVLKWFTLENEETDGNTRIKVNLMLCPNEAKNKWEFIRVTIRKTKKGA